MPYDIPQFDFNSDGMTEEYIAAIMLRQIGEPIPLDIYAAITAQGYDPDQIDYTYA
jgi:hypothetical protein